MTFCPGRIFVHIKPQKGSHVAHYTALQSLRKDLNVWRKFFAVSLNAIIEMYRTQRGDN